MEDRNWQEDPELLKILSPPGKVDSRTLYSIIKQKDRRGCYIWQLQRMVGTPLNS